MSRPFGRAIFAVAEFLLLSCLRATLLNERSPKKETFHSQRASLLYRANTKNMKGGGEESCVHLVCTSSSSNNKNNEPAPCSPFVRVAECRAYGSLHFAAAASIESFVLAYRTVGLFLVLALAISNRGVV